MADGGLDYAYGYSAAGIENFLDEVKGYMLETCGQNAIDNLSNINQVLDDNWDGQAKEDYKNILKADAEKFKSNLEVLYTAFENEIKNTGASFENLDKSMFNNAGIE